MVCAFRSKQLRHRVDRLRTAHRVLCCCCYCSCSTKYIMYHNTFLALPIDIYNDNNIIYIEMTFSIVSVFCIHDDDDDEHVHDPRNTFNAFISALDRTRISSRLSALNAFVGRTTTSCTRQSTSYCSSID